MRKVCLLVALLVWSWPAFAQPIDNGAITAVSTASGCTIVASCSTFLLSNQVVQSVTLSITGTFTGTLLFESCGSVTCDNTSANWFTIVGVKRSDGSTSSGFASVAGTNTGQFAFPNSGLMAIRVRATAWTSGTAVISAVRGYASALGQGPFSLPIQAPASGTCVTPAYTFTGDTDTGMGWLGANNAAGCAGGATIFDWNASRVNFNVPLQSTGILTTTVDNIITTSTDGFVVQNTTAATSGVPVQMAPRIRQRGTTWDTAASQTVDFFTEHLPVSGGSPSSTWKLGYSLNGAAATYPLTVTSGGLLTTLSSIVIPAASSYSFASTGFFTGGGSTGVFLLRNQAANAGVGLDVATDNVLAIRNRAVNADASIRASIHSSSTVSALTVSSNTIAPTSTIHQVGAGLIKTITVPTTCTPTCFLFIEPTAAYTYDATGNILVPVGGGLATVSRLMVFAWNGTKWVPSY